jgi:hypothetical protein
VFIVPLVVVGTGLTLLGLVVLLSREQWTLDRNLLTITSRLFGWRSQQQFVDGQLVLTRLQTHRAGGDSNGAVWEWQLQLQDAGGQQLRVLHRHTHDESPRLLGRLIAKPTLWPLREAI